MKKILALPCNAAKNYRVIPPDDGTAVEWRKAMLMTQSLAERVVPHPGPWMKLHFETHTYATFNWKKRVQYHFARYRFWPDVFAPPEERCLFLFKAPFRWGKLTWWFPDPTNAYPLFRPLDLLNDMTPNVMFAHNWYGWTFPPATELYTDEEWKLVTEWERVVFHYNHEYKRCIARHDFLDRTVTIIGTDKVGVVKEILLPKREMELWNPGTPGEKWAVLKKQWMKSLPIRYRVQTPDKIDFLVTRRDISRF